MHPHRAPRQFIDQQKISKHLYCSICHQVFDNPTRMRCGHTFCYDCMFNWRKMSRTCPECKTKFQKWQPEKDLVAAHIIDDFETKCVFGKCQWTGLYSGLKKHQRFCLFREKRQFDQLSGEEVVKVLDEVEDSDVREIKDEQKRGKKKVKKNQENLNMPQFPESQSQPESINIQPLQPNRRLSFQPSSHHQSQGITNSQNQSSIQSSSHHQSQQIFNAQNRSHIESSSSDDYLQTNLAKIIKQGRPWPFQNLSHKIQCEHNEQKNERIISKQLGDISFDDDMQKYRLYPRDDNKKLGNRSNKRKRNSQWQADELDDQQEFFRNLDYKYQQPPNLYVYKRFMQQEQRQKRQKAQSLMTPKWNIVHPNTHTSKAQDSDSSNMSNPFDEPIPQKSKIKSKKLLKKDSKVKEVIILDSSEESQVHLSKQSGEISQKLHQGSVCKITSELTQNPESCGDETKEKTLIECRQKDKLQCKMPKLSYQNARKGDNYREQPIDLSKSESLEY